MKLLQKTIITSLTLVTLGTVLTGCVPEGLKPLPDEQRYARIDKVLNDIDYQNIGEIVKEEKDEGGSAFAPAYKKFYIKDEKTLAKISSNFKKYTDKCSYEKGDKQVSCTYNEVSIIYSISSEGDELVYLGLTDGSGGR